MPTLNSNCAQLARTPVARKKCAAFAGSTAMVLGLGFVACSRAKFCSDGLIWSPMTQQCSAPVASSGALGKPIYGKWRVVDIVQPGITGMSTREAKGWIGRVAFFSDTLVAFGADRCRAPKYAVDTTTASQFAADTRAFPAELGLGDTIVSTVVRCPKEWASPGSELYRRGTELIASWEGTYFVLRRQ
jgi:hypothetical protein